ncbi:MAG: hypothetical protein MN733_11960 [Nitrososphaera sp.]|nr:hypothetical protein [Nitrososphaera sp.]
MHTSKKYTGLLAIALAVTLSTVFAQSASAVDPPNTKVRAFQNGLLIDSGNPGQVGTDTDCVGGVDPDAGAVSMTCYLIPPGVSNDDNSNAIAQDSTAVNIPCPPDAGFNDHECFSVTFSGALFDQQGDWHFHAEFFDEQANIITDGDHTFANNSFFVLPESPIGILALVISSLAVLGGFMFLRGRHNSQLPI